MTMSRIASVEILGVRVVREGREIRFEGVDEAAELALRGLGSTSSSAALVSGVRAAEAAGEMRSDKRFEEAMTAVVAVLEVPGVLDEVDEAAGKAIMDVLWPLLLAAPEGALFVLYAFETGTLHRATRKLGAPHRRQPGERLAAVGIVVKTYFKLLRSSLTQMRQNLGERIGG